MQPTFSRITSIDPEQRFILDNFELQHTERLEIESLRTLFRSVTAAVPFTKKADALKEALPIAQKRLGRVQTFEKLFFENDAAYKREPMVAASLIGPNADNIPTLKHNNPFENLRIAFYDTLPKEIHLHRQNAIVLAAVGIDPFSQPTKEDIFCAHLEALEMCDTIKPNLDYYSAEAADDLLGLTFPSWESFIVRESYPGQQLQREIVEMVTHLHKKATTKATTPEVIAFPTPKL